MKRVLMLLLIVLLPLSVMAMTQISDNDLSMVTGQAGVSINADITMNISFGEMGWGDADGYGTDAGGWIGLDQLEINQLHIWPRTDMTMESNGTGAGEGGWVDLQFLTIDVVTFADTSAIAGINAGPFFYNGQAGLVNDEFTAVRIGVPTFTITMDEMHSNVVLGPIGSTNSIGGIVNGAYYAEKAPNTPAFNQLLGKCCLIGLNMAFAPDGAVLISAHGGGTAAGNSGILYGSGVTIDLEDVTIAYMLIDSVCWGDIDGALDISLATSTATDEATAKDTEGLRGQGFIGLKDLAIENLSFDGKIAIDVGTLLASDGTTLLPISAAGTAAFLDMAEVFEDAYNANWMAQGWPTDGGKTFVAIAIVNGFEIRMDQMGATVSLGPTCPVLNQDMGDIYVGDMDVTIYMDQLTKTQSFIQIFAR